MAAKVQQPGRIFGFVGTFITAVDAVVIVAMTLVFGRFKAGCNYIEVPYVTEAGAPSFTTCTESKLHDREQTEAGQQRWLRADSSDPWDELHGKVTARA